MRVKVAELPFESVDSWIEKQRAKLEDARDQVSLVSFVKKERESLARRAKPLEGVSLMRKYTGLMDLVIARLLDVAVLEAEKEAPPGSAGLQIAVAATGGYGRGELCPFSDIDVVFIAEDDESPGLDAVVRRMFHLIMDVFLSGVKLKVGYSYRQPDQLLGLLHETQTALLDARRLAGSEMLFQRFQSALRDSIDPLEFLRRNRAHREQARQRFGQSPHRVEPNIKEGAGGLRDIHTARWAAQVAFGVSGERAFEELHAQGALTDLELSQAVAALDFLSGLRNALHLSSGRGNDALTVERQEAVPAKISFPKDLSSADLLMRSYYTHAENVDYLLAKILDFCDEQRIVIEPGIVAKRGILYVEAAVEPKSITRIIGYAQHYRLALAQNAQDAIRHTLLLQPVEVDRESQRRFFNSLSDPQVSNTLTQIARIGALQWILPEFADLMHLLPGDAAHEHTVGEHSLQVARNLDALKRDEDEEIRGIFADIKDRRTLFLAGLLHDVGKTNSNGNHAELGAVTAEAAAKRIGMPDEDAAKVGFLVRHHLLMGETARLRDLNEPKTVSEFVAIVYDMDLLRMLFLLTLADFRAVGDANWSAVHVRFLRELYHRAARLLSSPSAQDYELDIERHKRRVRRELTLANLPPAEVDEHSACMPVTYLLNTSPEDMAAHIDYVRQVRSGTPVVELRDDRMSDFTMLTICAFDDPKPGLLAKIAGALYALDVDIHAAEVFTRECSDSIAIDTLYIDFEACQLPEFKKRQVAADLTKVLMGKISIEELLKERGKRLQRTLDVRDLVILSHLSDRHTVLELSADDCEGLLYHLTRGISSLGWNIHGARVTTFSGRARDAFYVTDTTGNKLAPDSIAGLIEALSAPAE